jgi:hypothetical protein
VENRDWRVAERWSCSWLCGAPAWPLGRRRAEAGQAASGPGQRRPGCGDKPGLQERGHAATRGLSGRPCDCGRDSGGTPTPDTGAAECGREEVRNRTGDAEKRNHEGRASGGDGLMGDGALAGGKPGTG